ncbi:ribokinase [Leptothermofonsia sichuanensis E412]|uniref:ribokinase n=1 Tax=Leptothermofonsia sichuanensis TaxID=2917832 RepID=UPI001CA72F04|nr:ribokinase [Leptothermofonsia sichuanensis]QZZ19769.1 ribokinase [Leptothermofonsia sichuanensis E412]
MTAIVFGSINMDLVARTPRLPEEGETLLGSDFFMTPGGKGANQAVALAKLRVPTQMVGRVGADAFGQELLAHLKLAGVQTSSVLVDQDHHSGVAIITVADGGKNQIIGVLGANGQMGAGDVERLKVLLPQAQVLLLQLEVPLSAVRAAARAAHQAGVRVILDPAPVQTTQLTDLYPLLDILVPNEVEAGQLVGFSVNDPETAARAATVLRQQGANTVIVKLGGQGAFCASANEMFWVPAFAVEAVDTVAAGDAFAGGLVAALVEGLPLQQAVIWGAAAGALAVTRVGAQAAMSDRPEFEAFLAERGAG